MSSPAAEKNSNLGVHLSVLRVLPEVIGKSVEAEVHPDYNKGADGIRDRANGYSEDKLIHRFYGLVEIDGVGYRVKTTIIESRENKSPTTPHNFEVTEIELLPEGSSSMLEPTVSRKEPGAPSRTAKLLHGVEKSYDPGVKLLDASEKNPSEKYTSSAGYGEAKEDDVLYRSEENMSDADRLLAIEALEPVKVERNNMTREELREAYHALPPVKKNGRVIEFSHSAFKKIFKEGGLFAQVAPILDEVLDKSVLAYSEEDNLGGTIRPDDTVHKGLCK